MWKKRGPVGFEEGAGTAGRPVLAASACCGPDRSCRVSATANPSAARNATGARRRAHRLPGGSGSMGLAAAWPVDVSE